MLDKEILALSSALYSPLFATRDTIKDAYTYAQSIAITTENPAAMTTAIHVLMNTIAEHLENTVRLEHRAEYEAMHSNQESREG